MFCEKSREGEIDVGGWASRQSLDLNWALKDGGDKVRLRECMALREPWGELR